LLGRALQLHQRGQLDEAEAIYRELLRANPQDPDALHFLGLIQHQRVNATAALALYDKSIAIAPRNAACLSNRGNALFDLGRFAEAEESHRGAVEVDPDLATAHNNRGNAQRKIGALAEALQSYDRALSLSPQSAEARNNRGSVLRDLGRLDEAALEFRAAVTMAPDYAEAHSNLAATLIDLGEFDQARDLLDKAIALSPSLAAAHYNRAIALYEQRHFTESKESAQRALDLQPDLAAAAVTLGNAHLALGDLSQATQCYERALTIEPESLLARSAALFAMNYKGGKTTRAMLAEARRYGAAIARRAQPFTTRRSQSEILKIGFVSPDLWSHPVGYFLESTLQALSKQGNGRLRLCVYSSTRRPDSLTHRLQAYCDVWREVRLLSDIDLARQIQQDEIDILIDLSGHTAGNRLLVFAYKPAPVQVSWLGYFATTGVDAIDYVIADPYIAPPQEDANFTEVLWRLPSVRICFTPPADPLEVGSPPALTNGFVTFGCFNTLTKINEDVVRCWGRVLNAAPNSRLLLKAPQFTERSICTRVADAFSKAGIDSSRLEFEGPSRRAEYMKRYGSVDICLDPFPFPGGTTTVEALWMGVPVVTLRGHNFISRQGEALLTATGLTDLIADDENSYVAIAARIASDRGALANLRTSLRSALENSPVMDAASFARDFERALRDMWTEHKNGTFG